MLRDEVETALLVGAKVVNALEVEAAMLKRKRENFMLLKILVIRAVVVN